MTTLFPSYPNTSLIVPLPLSDSSLTLSALAIAGLLADPGRLDMIQTNPVQAVGIERCPAPSRPGPPADSQPHAEVPPMPLLDDYSGPIATSG